MGKIAFKFVFTQDISRFQMQTETILPQCREQSSLSTQLAALAAACRPVRPRPGVEIYSRIDKQSVRILKKNATIVEQKVNQ